MAKIHETILAVMKEVGVIEKNRLNDAQRYQFRGIEDFYNTMHPAFCNHGLFVVPRVKSIKREERASKSGGLNIWSILDIEFDFIAEDGSIITASVPGEAMDAGDKGINKALSAGLKYLLTQTLMVPTEKVEDADYHSPEVADPAKLSTHKYQAMLAAWRGSFADNEKALDELAKLVNLDIDTKDLSPHVLLKTILEPEGVVFDSAKKQVLGFNDSHEAMLLGLFEKVRNNL